eukprot:1232840-Rhodomonas_salina.1
MHVERTCSHEKLQRTAELVTASIRRNSVRLEHAILRGKGSLCDSIREDRQAIVREFDCVQSFAVQAQLLRTAA